MNILDYKQHKNADTLAQKNSRWQPHENNVSPNNCTIKKILNEIQSDLKEADSLNYNMAKSEFDKSLKASQSYKYIHSNDINTEQQTKPKKEENLYLYYSNLGRQYMSNKKNKNLSSKKPKMLDGIYAPKVDLPTFTIGRTRSLIDLKQAGSNVIGGTKSFMPSQDNQMIMNQFNDILQSRKGNRKYNRSSMRTMPSSDMAGHQNYEKQMHPKHYPTRRTEQNKMMFNEIFVKPKLDKLKKLEYQREQELKKFSLPQISLLNKKQEKVSEDNPTASILVKERQDKLREANKDERSLDISSLIEKRRFNKNSDNLFGDEDEEDAFKKIDQSDFRQLKDEDLKEFKNKATSDNLFDFQNQLTQSIADFGEEDDNNIINVLMKKFNTKTKNRSVGSFFSQQIQVQPPEGLINIIGSEGSWAPSIPLNNIGTSKSMPNSKKAQKSLNDTSLMDIKMRSKAGVQAGDVKKEAHMAFCLGSLNEDKNINKAIRYYKRFFFCARILEDPVGAALALNRLGVAYHKQKNYDKSLMFHMKHKEYTDKENLFAAYYNLGITQRFLKMYDESILSFSKALEWASTHQELDSE